MCRFYANTASVSHGAPVSMVLRIHRNLTTNFLQIPRDNCMPYQLHLRLLDIRTKLLEHTRVHM